MIRRTLALALVALALAGMAGAAAQSDNAIAADATGATVTFTTAKKSIFFRNDGAQSVSVKTYAGSDTIAIHTNAASGSVVIKAGEGLTIGWDAQQDGGIGFTGFSHRCAAAESTTLRYYAK